MEFESTVLLMLAIAPLMAVVQNGIHQGIPTRVLKSFDKRYHLVISLVWTSRPPVYIANFISHGKKCYTRFNQKGQWVEEGTEISALEITPELQDQFSCWVPLSKINTYFSVKRKSLSRAFMCCGEIGGNIFEVLFTEDGELIRHERFKKA